MKNRSRPAPAFGKSGLLGLFRFKSPQIDKQHFVIAAFAEMTDIVFGLGLASMSIVRSFWFSDAKACPRQQRRIEAYVVCARSHNIFSED
jgi:hypothetical protein